MAGLPGSGKSTLAARLAEEINSHTEPHTMMALSMDGFHLSKAELGQLPNPHAAFARRGAPWTFDTDKLLKRLQLLRDVAGREVVQWPGFEHEIGAPVEGAYSVLPATRLVLVEGLYLLHQNDEWKAIGQFFDDRWYLDTDFEVAMERLAHRHMSAWNLTRAEAQSRIEANDRLNAEIVQESQELALLRLMG